METTPQEFISADDYGSSAAATTKEAHPTVIDRPPFEETMAALASTDTRNIRVPRTKTGPNRAQVVVAFQDAFELIGGTTRLALWADSHTSEFYRLYAKLLPSQANNTNEQTGEVRVLHVLPPGPLDK